MYRISDGAGNVRGNPGDDFDPKGLVLGIGVLLCDDAIIIGLLIGVNKSFRITEVMIGPFDFRPDADEPV